MRRIPLSATLLPALALMTIAGLITADSASAQAIRIEPTAIDLGTMNQMEARTVKVKVTNVGAGLLVIEDVHADCGCTVPDLQVTSLGPGESTDLTIHFDSKRFSGPQHKLIKITSNDPDHRVLELPLIVDVNTPLLIDPRAERIGFSRALAGSVETRTVTFTAPDAALRLQADKSEKGLFDVKIINNVDGDSHKGALEITRPARMMPGRHQDIVRVATNLPERPTVDIEVRAWIDMELSAAPDVVNFRYQPTFEQDVKIFAAKPPFDFKVTRAEIDLPEVKLTIDETVPRQETHIKLTGAPIAKSDPRAIASGGRITGTLKIYTTSKAVPVIEVPVSYMIRM